MDKIIDIIAISSIIIFILALIIAIWCGIIGVKIALTAAVIFASDWMLNQIIKEKKEKKEKER